MPPRRRGWQTLDVQDFLDRIVGRNRGQTDWFLDYCHHTEEAIASLVRVALESLGLETTTNHSTAELKPPDNVSRLLAAAHCSRYGQPRDKILEMLRSCDGEPNCLALLNATVAVGASALPVWCSPGYGVGSINRQWKDYFGENRAVIGDSLGLARLLAAVSEDGSSREDSSRLTQSPVDLLASLRRGSYYADPSRFLFRSAFRVTSEIVELILPLRRPAAGSIEVSLMGCGAGVVSMFADKDLLLEIGSPDQPDRHSVRLSDEVLRSTKSILLQFQVEPRHEALDDHERIRSGEAPFFWSTFGWIWSARLLPW